MLSRAEWGPAEKSEIERLFYLTSHLDVEEVTDSEGNPVIKDWKFFITSETSELE